jgi:amidase
MALSDELAYLRVIEIARGIRQRHFSPAEVLDAFIAGIEARDRSINAFIYRGFDEARVKAKEPASTAATSVRICPTPR